MQSRQSVMARIQTFEKSSTSPNDAMVFYSSPGLSKSLGDLDAILDLDEQDLSLDDHDDDISPPSVTVMMSVSDDNDDKRSKTNALQNRLDALRNKYNHDRRTWQSQEMELKRLRQECQALQGSAGNGNDDLEINEQLRQHVHELQLALEQERRQNQNVKEELHLCQTTKVQEHEIKIQVKDYMIQGLENGLQMANDALANKEHAYKANLANLEEQELQSMRSSKEALQMVHATLQTKDTDISLLQAKLNAAQDAMLVQTNTIAELQRKLETKRTSSNTTTPTKKKKKRDGSKSKTTSKKQVAAKDI
jgi:chromosome segregation ATPase